MNWPFLKKETRQAAYSDAIVLAIQQAAAGGTKQYRTAVIETCAGLWSRAFSSATVNGTDAVSKAMLANIGRRLCETGEAVYAIEVEGGAADSRAGGNVDSDKRRAALDVRTDAISRPSSILTIHRPAESVLHFRYAR